MSWLTRARQAASKLAAELRPAPFELPANRQRLVDFTSDKLACWQLQTDAPIGGHSQCALTPMNDGSSSSHAVWSGHTSLEADRLKQQQFAKSDQKKVASRVGFSAIMLTVEDEAWALRDFHGLCLRCRPLDARKYVLTLRAANTLGDHRTEDLYQTLLQPFVRHAKPAEEAAEVEPEAAAATAATATGGNVAPAGNAAACGAESPLLDVRVPWGAFTLTWRGYVQSERPPAMNLDQISHVGLLLADSTAGDFGIELSQLSAFRFDEHELVHDAHVRECFELNRLAGYEPG
jgi:hypothetical protein